LARRRRDPLHGRDLHHLRLWRLGYLLRIYPAAIAAPFSLLVPVFGTLSAALILWESFGPARLAGMVLILLGLAVVVLPLRWFRFMLPPSG
jgi:hypothetical protein